MKKLAIIFTVLIAAIFAGIIGIRVQSPDRDITEKETKVGVLLNGKKTDASWNQAHADAFEKIEDELNLDVILAERVPYGDEAVQTMEDLIGEGCKIIFAESVGYANAVAAEEKAHPEIIFYHCSGTRFGDNCTAFFARNYESRYLAGIAAGASTETGKIGYVAAYGYTEVIRGIDAFTLGARSVNPDAEVIVEYTKSWDDYQAAYEAAKKLIRQDGCDIIAHHTDTLAPLQAADDLGTRSIGNNYDNRGRYQNSNICCITMDWSSYYYDEIKSCLEGRFYGKNDWLGLSTGSCGLTELTDKAGEGKAKAEAAISEAEKKMEAGTWDVFFGPVTDNESTVRILAGEAASDDYLLNDMNWYVQGVTVHE